MDDYSRSNFKVFNDLSNPLYISTNPSKTIIYNSLGGAQTNTTLWTPATGLSIYLTAIQISTAALLTVTISLERADNDVFAVIRLTTTINSYNANYFSPIKFNPNETIYVTSSSGLDITLFGYET